MVAAVQSSHPLVDAMAQRSKSDPEAKQMIEGLQIVAGWAQSTSAAIAYLMLILYQMGIGSLWMTGPLHAKAKIEKLLNLPNKLDIIALVAAGYPAENPVKDRKPVSEVCQVIK